jgi:hypothetical protein
VSGIKRVDVCERQNPVGFENLETRDLSPDDLAEDAAFH